jgi:chromosome segregation ATPase
MTDKLRELASDMEANKPVNNPGNWNMLLAIADRLEAKDREIAELKAKLKERDDELKELKSKITPYQFVEPNNAYEWRQQANILRIDLLSTIDKMSELVEKIEKDKEEKERDELVSQMAEKANHLVHLHGCEQEGLMSGKPTFEQWINAVGSLQEILTRYSNLKAK